MVPLFSIIRERPNLTGTAPAAWARSAQPGCTDLGTARPDRRGDAARRGRQGITTSNLNRCAPFGHAGLGQAKPDEAARLAVRTAPITWHSGEEQLQQLLVEIGETTPVAAGAVDRAGVVALEHDWLAQKLPMPAAVASAATSESGGAWRVGSG
jgi:hypothetical protein